jgi:hypothetical protein
MHSETALQSVAASVAAIPNMGVQINSPYFATRLARCYREAGRSHDGLAVLEAVRPSMEARGELWWRAEIHRLEGELLVSGSDARSEAEGCFRRALQVARHQQAKSLELRASISLSRLLCDTGEQRQARELLLNCVSSLGEGAATADQRQAARMLAEL